MTSVFDAATAVTSDDSHQGRWDADLSDGWLIGGGLNGGYLLATVGRAVRAALPGKPDPLAISAHYLSASRPGPAEVDVRVLREGGSVATAAAELRQSGATRISALATYGDLARLAAGADDVRTTASPPDLPPPDDCVPNSVAPVDLEAASLLQRFDMRFHPDDVGWAVGEPNNSGVMRAWFRLEDDREPDPLSLLLVLDALPPVTFTYGAMGWAPTIELTAHVRAVPAPGWLRVTHASRNMAGGLFEEDCEVWDSAGRLVAQSRQLARMPRPVG
ncbi:acyl-CoA thioesterase II [Nocardioides sp.]|uniref:acyl-CoA thioesterase n=1 Tax=Nocardioides sp. TaxID=35761 RepID=UPI00271C11F8|nr:thioesterase family protein [Nocardioides sp.]MDO9456203.1 thioesterase family protein [Nocardioides sp.]